MLTLLVVFFPAISVGSISSPWHKTFDVSCTILPTAFPTISLMAVVLVGETVERAGGGGSPWSNKRGGLSSWRESGPVVAGNGVVTSGHGQSQLWSRVALRIVSWVTSGQGRVTVAGRR